MNRNLLQVKYHFLYGRLCHNKKIINIILIINILQKQKSKQCNKKVLNPSLGRKERERDGEGRGLARGGAWRPGRERTFKIKKRGNRRRTSSLRQIGRRKWNYGWREREEEDHGKPARTHTAANHANDANGGFLPPLKEKDS